MLLLFFAKRRSIGNLDQLIEPLSKESAFGQCITLPYRLLRANHSKAWGAKPLAYVPRARDMAAGLPGTHSTSGGAVRRARPC